MKKFLDIITIGLISIGILGLVLLWCLCAFTNLEEQGQETYYPTTMTVTSVKNDIVTLEDFNGYVWEFEGAEDWLVGDICACIMNDKGTPSILDDEIVKTKYCGFQ